MSGRPSAPATAEKNRQYTKLEERARDLVRDLSSPEEAVRAAAAEALCALEDPAAIRILARSAAHPGHEVRYQVKKALRTIRDRLGSPFDEMVRDITTPGSAAAEVSPGRSRTFVLLGLAAVLLQGWLLFLFLSREATVSKDGTPSVRTGATVVAPQALSTIRFENDVPRIKVRGRVTRFDEIGRVARLDLSAFGDQCLATFPATVKFVPTPGQTVELEGEVVQNDNLSPLRMTVRSAKSLDRPGR